MAASPSGSSMLVGGVDPLRWCDTSAGGCTKTSAAVLSRERSLAGTRGIDTVHGGRVRRGQYRRPKCSRHEIVAHTHGDINDHRGADGRNNGGGTTPRNRADSAHANGKLTSRDGTLPSRFVRQIFGAVIWPRTRGTPLGRRRRKPTASRPAQPLRRRAGRSHCPSSGRALVRSRTVEDPRRAGHS
jgi:hypothetical protein